MSAPNAEMVGHITREEWLAVNDRITATAKGRPYRPQKFTTNRFYAALAVAAQEGNGAAAACLMAVIHAMSSDTVQASDTATVRHEQQPARVVAVRPMASDTVQASDTVSCTALVHVPSDTKASDTAIDKARARRARYDQSLKGKAARSIRRATR